ncbi:MAG TPA: aminotransferase class III-fold pyridoxal phosphate-dependent enzyme, partial [Verrucomicrobiae bacterium]|nr:aminotransferase class III-fold pyridoxal phosphate-dependent enzyme [Verrucomicrobiae bacterium]
MTQPHFPKSMEWFERASRVIPCGIYGHAAPAAMVPTEFPYYAARAEGCHYWDVDGREYLDFLCSYGPVILGHHHPEVEAAAERQSKLGDCLNHPAPVMVELCERLVDIVDFADWAVLGKNGSDMTTWAIQLAREFTGRKKILRARQSYHGSHPWCTPGHGGLIEEDRAHIHEFIWNDLDSVRDLVKKHRDDVAGLITTPFLHPPFGDSELPAPGFLQGVQEICRKEGIVFIVDDIRAGFRLDFGGSHKYFSFEPDVICFSKALGNGYPISAALGRKELRVAASRVFLTGSFWYGAVAMAASLACLQVMEREKTAAHVLRIGQLFMDGLKERAARHGLEVRVSGPPSLPFLKF